jgi:hypothetical protein
MHTEGLKKKEEKQMNDNSLRVSSGLMLRRWTAFGLAIFGMAALTTLTAFPAIVGFMPFWLTGNGEIGRLITYQVLTLVMTVVIAIITARLIPDAFGRYFRVGDLAAPAGPVRVLGIRAGDTWRQIGARFMVIIASVTAAVVLLPAVAGDGFSLGLPYVALALCLAASNAFVEEYLTRFQIVASLRGTMSPGRIAIVSGALFGSAHYLGTPGGPVGVVLAGFLGWLLAKSVLETRGIGWAWFIHFVLDVIIFVAILGSL